MPAAQAALRLAPHQRARGVGEVVMGERLRRLYQEGCAQIRMPRDPDNATPTAVLINTAGGLAGGDQLRWRASAEAGSALTVTSQACERAYRSLGDEARVSADLLAGPGARLAWLPQETILYDGGRLSRRLEADIAPDAALVLCEAVILGRTAMGETVSAGALQDRWRIRCGGRLVFADDLRLDGDIAATAARPAALAGARAFASFLLVALDAEERLEAVRAALGDSGGASAWDGKLFGRILAPDGLALRRTLIPTLRALTGQPLPRVWSL
jgi:urease accessory protein